MGLQHSYRLIAPFYDLAIERTTRSPRQRSLAALPATPGRILLAGVGTGLDLPHLPTQHRYVGVDLTGAMLRRSLPRARHLDFKAVQGDMHCLPFADASFDAVIAHLILAVVPQPALCLAEISRVLKPGGEALILDKFLRRQQKAPLRRLLNPLARRIATRLDVVFEDLLDGESGLALREDSPALAGGWFRRIRLVRR
ncbi:MAG: class I SAM-dependent methyltransferase [Dechloromonas sp.]|uniref:Class I SAM-dependent methyltransferase n=1 Tax=Azonexus hydrophilus TaxID=418702 RepID=A0ABZ2XIP8_9RHOO|nr:class I SAM-dependent methyltransferase [Azonexus hydrophilus]MCA1937581.1 class I SAM-dependent methyltransferase [Dechloromonas sp.]